MSSFRIPLVWQMYGHVDVEADTLDALSNTPWGRIARFLKASM